MGHIQKYRACRGFFHTVGRRVGSGCCCVPLRSLLSCPSRTRRLVGRPHLGSGPLPGGSESEWEPPALNLPPVDYSAFGSERSEPPGAFERCFCPQSPLVLEVTWGQVTRKMTFNRIVFHFRCCRDVLVGWLWFFSKNVFCNYMVGTKIIIVHHGNVH